MPQLLVLLKCITIALLAFVSGCSIYSVPGSEPAPVESRPQYTPVTPESTIPATSPIPTAPQTMPPVSDPNSSDAYQGLLNKADTASRRGDYEQALALLERAQRIDPDSGEIYLGLAKTYRDKGDENLAAATAERGLLYCESKAQCEALRRYLN